MAVVLVVNVVVANIVSQSQHGLFYQLILF
jgi:hypothetical protein